MFPWLKDFGGIIPGMSIAGRSIFFGGEISIGDIVYHAHALLNKLHMHKVIIVGHSMGGDMAPHFAAKYPDRTFAVIAIGAVNANKSAAGTFEKRV
jgi:homoserine acetyltransferase